jgi:hypothetical protein
VLERSSTSQGRGFPTCNIALAAEPANLLANGGFEVTARWAQEWLAEFSKQAHLKDFDPP